MERRRQQKSSSDVSQSQSLLPPDLLMVLMTFVNLRAGIEIPNSNVDISASMFLVFAPIEPIATSPTSVELNTLLEIDWISTSRCWLFTGIDEDEEEEDDDEEEDIAGDLDEADDEDEEDVGEERRD